MFYYRICLISVLMILTAFIIGCSGNNAPVTPENTAGSIDILPVLDLTEAGNTFNAVGIMGAYELYIDPSDFSAELVNKRVSSIGEDYIVSGVAFFTVAPCADCLKIVGISLTPGGVALLTFAIRHPFPEGITSEPPTAANRLDLNVFDLAAVIMPGGDPAPTATTYTLTGADIYTGFCVGADGYTCELADVVGDDAGLPYFLVVDDYAVFPPDATFNEFAMGDSGEFDVGFDMTSGTLVFDMYLTMGYGFSAKKPNRLTPKYYNPEFNRKAAWKVVVTPPEGTDPPAISNTWQDNDITTPFNVTVDVYDWQIDATVWDGTTPPTFDEADADNVWAASEPSSVSVEVPGMSTTLPEATAPDDPLADPWIFTVGVVNENGLVPGEYLGLVKVTDERPALSPADGRDFLIDTVDGINLDHYSMPEHATYQVFIATVVLGCGPITGQVDEPNCPIVGVSNGQTINFTVSASSDYGGAPITGYEVDFDYDGSVFAGDGSSITGIFPDVGPFTVPDPCDDNIPSDYTVAFRASDSCDPPNVTVFATCLVTVDKCHQPVGNVTLTVERESGQRQRIDATGPWTLSWDAADGAVEYAIYYDDDPSDGLTNSLAAVGVTTGLTYTVPASHLPGDRVVYGCTYVVNSRSTIGDPSSEAADSQPAHVISNSMTSIPTNAIMGSTASNGEGWRYGVEGSYQSYLYNPRGNTNSSSYASAPMGCDYLSGRVGSTLYNGRTMVMTRPTPTVPDSSVRFIDFVMYLNGTWGTSTGYDGGVSLGTIATQPLNNWTSGNWGNMVWHDCESTGSYNDYTNNSPFLPWDMSNYSSGNNCWEWTGFVSHRLYGGNVGTSSAEYVAFCSFRRAYSFSYQPFLDWDDVAIAIY